LTGAGKTELNQLLSEERVLLVIINIDFGEMLAGAAGYHKTLKVLGKQPENC
jgi:L-lactate permease